MTSQFTLKLDVTTSNYTSVYSINTGKTYYLNCYIKQMNKLYMINSHTCHYIEKHYKQQ